MHVSSVIEVQVVRCLRLIRFVRSRVVAILKIWSRDFWRVPLVSGALSWGPPSSNEFERKSSYGPRIAPGLYTCHGTDGAGALA